MASKPVEPDRILVPPALIEAVVRRFDPLQVILFGGRTRGEAGPDSDWDLLVVVDDEAPVERLRLRAGYEAVAGSGLAANVVPCRQSWFDYKRDVVSSLAWIADTQGSVVYERSARQQAA